MTEARRADLVYGHLGEAVYDTDNQEWRFSRRPCTGQQLKLIGQPSVAIEASLPQNNSSIIQSATARTQNIKKLVQTYPELVPGLPLLPALAQASEVVSEVTSRHDPTISELVAFGTALNRDNPRTGTTTVPIIATAGGEAGDAIRLTVLSKKIVGWHGNKTVGLSLLEIQGKEQGWWSGNGGPIQQLSFEEGKDSTWLAVRYPGATTLLRPTLRRNTIPPISYAFRSQRAGLHAASRLDPNPIATLPKLRSGGAPHADVSFNPWYGKQFAIVDQEGHWSVWNIEYENKQRNLWTIEAGPAGTIQVEHNKPSEPSNIIADGWGSILWAGDMHTLTVFNRRTFVLCNLQDVSKRLAGPDLAPTKSGDWILDVKRSPSEKSQLFVATSSCIFWLSISGFGEVEEKGRLNPGTRILLSWRHFRYQEDISLRINVLGDTGYNPAFLEADTTDSEPEPATFAILYSRLTGLATVYTFQLSPSPLKLPISTSDPFVLRPSDGTNPSNELTATNHFSQQKSVSTLLLRRVECRARPGYGPSGPGKQYMNESVNFYQLLTLFHDLSVEQCLYASASTSQTALIRAPDSILQAELRLSAKVANDDFILPNGVLDEDIVEPRTGINRLRHRTHILEEESTSDQEDQWTVNFEWLERHIQSVASSSLSLWRTTIPIAKSLLDVLGTVQSVLENEPTSNEPGIKLLIENLNLHDFVDDIEPASTELYDMLTSAAEEEDLLKRVNMTPDPIPHATETDTAAPYHMSLLQTYNILVQTWIAPLPPSIPGRVRVTIERQIRYIATELYLASYAVHPHPGPGHNEGITEGSKPTESSAFTLPVRRKSSFSQKVKSPIPPSRSSSPLHSSQLSEDTGFAHPQTGPTLPTPTPTASLHSTPSTSSHLGSSDPATDHLRALASVAPQLMLPSAMQNILAHWDIGTNPEKYDWEALQAAAAAEIDEGEETEAQVRKRRRFEKLTRRKQDNATSSSSSQLRTPKMSFSQPVIPTIASSQLQPPPIAFPVPASQPQPQAGGLTQGSTQLDIVMPATQEERGVFGGRKKTKTLGATKKKKRPGF